MPIYRPQTKHVLPFVLFVLVALVVYWPALWGQFTNWDDHALVVDNPAIRSLSPNNVSIIFASTNRGAYLPVRVISYCVDYAIWGLNPFGYHLVNVLLHGVNGFLVYLLVCRLFGTQGTALLAAFCFLMHPMQVESVAWVSGRKEVLCGFFLLLSALYFFRHIPHPSSLFPYLASLIFFLAACLSKASAIMLPLLLIAACLSSECAEMGVRRLRLVLKRLLPFLALTVLLFAVNFFVGVSHGVVKTYHDGAGTTLRTMVRVIGEYATSILFPINLSAKYLVPLVPTIFCSEFLSAFFIILAVVLAICASRSRMAALGGMWFVIALLPFLNIIPISTLRADRYVYIAMIGVGVILGAIYNSVRVRVLAVPLVIFLSLLSWQRAHIWTDSVSLWRDTVRKSPLSPMSHANLGAAFLMRGQKALAEIEFQHALACDPSCSSALTNLAQIWNETGRKREALGAAQRAVNLDSANADAWINLGILQAERGDLEAAYLSFGKAAQHDPTIPEAYYNMGRIRYMQKRYRDAMRLYAQAVKVQPQFADAYLQLGILQAQARLLRSARESFQRLCELRPNDREALYNLALSHMQLDELEQAESAAEKSLRLGFQPAQKLLEQIRANKNKTPSDTKP